jgi:8-oxo-dGTP pyrophosphatase MutT (NUDIX family)
MVITEEDVVGTTGGSDSYGQVRALLRLGATRATTLVRSEGATVNAGGAETQKITQSAAVPYRLREGGTEVLLITPRGGDGWIVPKGKIQADLGARESARREAFEEAGVEGEMHPEPFGEYQHGGSKGALVSVFLLRLIREYTSWPESHERKRRWVRLEDAPLAVLEPGLARVLQDVVANLESST